MAAKGGKFVKVAEQIARQGGLRVKGQGKEMLGESHRDASPLALRKAGKRSKLGR